MPVISLLQHTTRAMSDSSSFLSSLACCACCACWACCACCGCLFACSLVCMIMCMLARVAVLDALAFFAIICGHPVFAALSEIACLLAYLLAAVYIGTSTSCFCTGLAVYLICPVNWRTGFWLMLSALFEDILEDYGLELLMPKREALPGESQENGAATCTWLLAYVYIYIYIYIYICRCIRTYVICYRILQIVYYIKPIGLPVIWCSCCWHGQHVHMYNCMSFSVPSTFYPMHSTSISVPRTLYLVAGTR